MRNIQSEFPDYPLDKVPPIPFDWEDHSWHNDACPRFFAGLTEAFDPVWVWIEYPEPEKREDPETERYCIQVGHDGEADAGSFIHNEYWYEIERDVGRLVKYPPRFVFNEYDAICDRLVLLKAVLRAQRDTSIDRILSGEALRLVELVLRLTHGGDD